MKLFKDMKRLQRGRGNPRLETEEKLTLRLKSEGNAEIGERQLKKCPRFVEYDGQSICSHLEMHWNFARTNGLEKMQEADDFVKIRGKFLSYTSIR